MSCALHDPPCSMPQIGVIPARFQSVRFPGKPLVKILGVPMVVRTWQQACLCKTLSKVIVATDDERIAEACSQEGAEVVMTSVSCANGMLPVHHSIWPVSNQSQAALRERHLDAAGSHDHPHLMGANAPPCSWHQILYQEVQRARELQWPLVV